MSKSADEWLASPEYLGVTILDPDGWDRFNFDTSWKEKITKREFNRRLSLSTSIIDKNLQGGLCPTCGALLKKDKKIYISVDFRQAIFDGVTKKFTPQQIMILDLLVSRRCRVVPHWLFLDNIYGLEADQPHHKIIDVHIHRIRQQLKNTNYRIDTIWGKGYTLVRREVK